MFRVIRRSVLAAVVALCAAPVAAQAASLAVTSTNPPLNAMAPATTTISVTFDRAVSLAQFTANRFRVFGRGTGTKSGSFALSNANQTVTFTPTTSPIDNSSELLSSERARTLVEELAQRYPTRIVVYDLPPVLAADDALAFLPNVDAVLLVMRDVKTLQRDIQRTLDLIRTKPLLGSVLNRTDAQTTPYHYRYG